MPKSVFSRPVTSASMPAGRQGRAHGVLDLADDLAAVAARGQHGAVQHLVAVGVHGREAQVLQLAEQHVQAQAVGDGRVDIERLARHAAALVGADHVQRACCAAGRPA